MPKPRSAPRQASVRATIASLGRNIHALLIREIARQSEGRLGYARMFIEPMAYIIGLSILRYELHPIPPLGTSMPLFFLNGVVVYFAFNRTEASVSAVLSKSKNVLNYPSIRPLDIYITQLIMGLGNMLVLYHVFLACHNFIMKNIAPEQVLWPEDILRIYEAIIMASMYGFIVGVFNASLEPFFPAWDKLYSIVRRAQLLFSGKMFVVDFMPTTMRNIVYWNPLMHPIELARSGFYDFYESKTMDLNYFYGTMLGAAVIAFSLERFARNKMVTEA